MENIKVEVMMSSYNGAEFLCEQVKSILLQENVNVHLTIRDDGSTDQTREILKEFEKDSRISVVTGQNIGWKKSFLYLLNNVKSEANTFYAFADQDDIWQPQKLVMGISKLKSDCPMLYHSNVTIMDNEKHVHGNRFSKNMIVTSRMPECFFNGYGVGATMVFNDQLLRVIQKYNIDVETPHDAYVLAVCSLLGRVIYDSNSYIMYRRHVGTATGFGSVKNDDNPTLWMRYKKYKKNPKHMFSDRAKLILKNYADQISPKNRKLLQVVSDYRTNVIHKILLLIDFIIKASSLRKTLQIKYRAMMNTL